MPKVKYISQDGTERAVDVETGASVMQGALDNMIDGIEAECGGFCSCATCHCYVDEIWFDKLSEASAFLPTGLFTDAIADNGVSDGVVRSWMTGP